MLHPLLMGIVTRLMRTERVISSFSHPIKAAYPSPDTVDIIFKYCWKLEMMNIVAERAAAWDVKLLTERHITVFLIECAALRSPKQRVCIAGQSNAEGPKSDYKIYK